MSEQPPSTLKTGRIPPGPPGLPVIGNLLTMRRQELLDFYMSMYRQYGEVVRLKLGPMESYLFVKPEHIQHILVKNVQTYAKGLGYEGLRLLMGQGLVTSEYEIWRSQRPIMQPYFTPRAIGQFAGMMTSVTARLLERWEKLAQGGKPVQIDNEMLRLTMSIIGEAMFNIDLSEEAVEIGQAFQSVFAFIAEYSVNPYGLPLWAPTPKNRRFSQHMKEIEAFIAQQIALGQREPGRENLLAALLRARDEQSGQGMDQKQLRDEAITLFFAGFETTARTLTWAWYLLAHHPEATEKLAAEGRQVLGADLPTMETLPRLEYARMVVDETLRLYPPTGVLSRQNIMDDEIDGYHIPAKSLIVLSPYITHRLPDIWDQPDAFIPERFAKNAPVSYPKHAYLPFGAGPRVCLGNNFALLEVVIALAMAAPRFRLEVVDPQPVGFAFRGTTRPTKDIYLKISAR
ncbi:MAG: cytochrome P450 [Anaerolineales bacterium]|nr:cytochrome P450 [Anaerolineales bacterium]